MNIERPDGANRVCGIDQGWQGLPIRDDDYSVKLNEREGGTLLVNRMVTRWSLTEEERLRVLAGEDIFVTVLGPTPAPHAGGRGRSKNLRLVSSWVSIGWAGRSEGHGMPDMKAGAIYADPPWKTITWDGVKSTPTLAKADPFKTMTMDELEALPVASMAAKDCVLIMWVTSEHLENGMRLMRAWGFAYKSLAFNWVKLTKDGKPKMGMGWWTRQGSEIALLGSVGHPRRILKGVRAVELARARRHSQKPDRYHDSVRELVKGPYLELFGRRPRFDWTVWGDEVEKHGAQSGT